jgi:hypothetical protein
MRREFDRAALYALVPEIYRTRDAERSRDGSPGPLESLLALVAEQLGVLEESLDQAYDDLFIETCAPWLVPYLGDLVGSTPPPRAAALAERAAVAHTLAYRRRAGTLAMIEQLARDTTGWPARVVEYSARLAATRSFRRSAAPALADVRHTASTAPSDEVLAGGARTVEVARSGAGRGRYNFPDLGIHLWRTRAYPLASPAVRAGEQQAYRFHPAGVDTPLFTLARAPRPFERASGAADLPLPLSRWRLARELAALYGADGALSIAADGVLVPPGEIAVRRLRARDGGWERGLEDRFTIDPESGRLVAPRWRRFRSLAVSFAYGFGLDIGGGPYDRMATLGEADAVRRAVPGGGPLESALAALAPDTLVEITTSDRFAVVPPVAVAAEAHLTIRAGDGVWPVLAPPAAIAISGGAGARCTLSGLLVVGVPVEIGGDFDLVRFEDCTFVPHGEHVAVVAGPRVRRIVFERCVLGPLQAGPGTQIELRACILDAGDPRRVAISGGPGPAGELEVGESTVYGTVETALLARASNTLFAGRVASERFADGCVRYSAFTGDDRLPPRFACAALDAPGTVLAFASRHYGSPDYFRLAAPTSDAVRRGADDGGEIGAYHGARFVEREDALRAALPGAVPLGLDAGLIFVT